jgi:LysM repeat protein
MKKLWEQHYYAIILFILSIFTAIVLIIQLGESENINYMTITVNEGDTLWRIAEDYSNEHTLTPKDFISWVERNNGILGERIFPGDELIIPVINNNGFKNHKEVASSKF